MTTSAAFSYQAARRDGTSERGVVHAASVSDAAALLSRRGLFPYEVKPGANVATKDTSMPARDLALGFRVLADLLESGLPVMRALRTLESIAPTAWRASLPGIIQSVREGRGLAAALSNSTLHIPPLLIGITQAGEAGSGLAPAVRRAAEVAEANAAMRAALVSALAYPAVVACAGIGSISLLIGVVLPRFAAILSDLGESLPATTQFVINASTAARAGFYPTIVTAVTGGVAWRWWTMTPAGRRHWHALLLSAPFVGSIRHSASTGRAAWSLSSLLDSGVPLPAAMTLAGRATGDAEIERRFAIASERIAAGTPISMALDDAGAVTPTAARLVRAGEESGRLASMLAHAAKLESERAERTLKTGVRMLEPVLLLSFAAIVAVVAAALLQAVYSVRPGG